MTKVKKPSAAQKPKRFWQTAHSFSLRPWVDQGWRPDAKKQKSTALVDKGRFSKRELPKETIWNNYLKDNRIIVTKYIRIFTPTRFQLKEYQAHHHPPKYTSYQKINHFKKDKKNSTSQKNERYIYIYLYNYSSKTRWVAWRWFGAAFVRRTTCGRLGRWRPATTAAASGWSWSRRLRPKRS